MAGSAPLDHALATALRAQIAKQGLATLATRTGVCELTLTRAAAGLGVFRGTARLIALAVSPQHAAAR